MPLEEPEARLALLTTELNAIQAGISSLNATMFQIKGWSVTIASGIVIASATIGSAYVSLVGLVAVVAFWVIDAHYKSLQGVFIHRDLEIQAIVRTRGIAAALGNQAGALELPGLASAFVTPAEYKGLSGEIKHEARLLAHEARKPLVFNVYLILLVLLVVDFALMVGFGVPMVAPPRG